MLVADTPLFQAGYVSSLLEEFGMRVVGPIVDGDQALAAAEGLELTAAVIGAANPRHKIEGMIHKNLP